MPSKPPALTGTFNGWALNESTERVSEHQYEVRRFLPRGRHAFKWVWNESWDNAWGAFGLDLGPDAPLGRGTGGLPLVAPMHGVAAPDGPNVDLHILSSGDHTITLDTRTRRFRVLRVDVPDLHCAFHPHDLAGGPLGEIMRRLREHGHDKPYGYNWNDWERLAPFLEEGAFRGLLPIRDGGRVLFVFNANLHAPLFMAGNMNGWQVGPDMFSRVDGTDVHLLYREYPADALLQYKLVHDGQWFTDPNNRWIEADGLPVPMFQIGTFNSVLDLGAHGHERGDHLLWVRFPSLVRGHIRDVYISLPRDYMHHRAHRYPVLYVNDGNEAVTRSYMHREARHAIDAGYAEPAIIVFVGLASQMDRNFEYSELDGRMLYADFLARELVPFIDGQFRTRAEPGGRGVVGASYGGIVSYYVGWRYPHVFGNVGGQGTSFYVQDWDVLRLYEEAPRYNLKLYMDSASPSHREAPRDNYRSSRYAERVLKSAGYRVFHVKRRDQRHDWSSWQERFPEVLHTFWPGRGA